MAHLTPARELALAVLATWPGFTEREIVEKYRFSLASRWMEDFFQRKGYRATAGDFNAAIRDREAYDPASLEGLRRRFSDLVGMNWATAQKGEDGSRILKVSFEAWRVREVGQGPWITLVAPSGVCDGEWFRINKGQLSEEVARTILPGTPLFGPSMEPLRIKTSNRTNLADWSQLSRLPHPYPKRVV
jgi:hypothetical protein